MSPSLIEVGAQAVHAVGRDAAVVEAVLLQDVRDGAHGAGRAHRLLPVAARKRGGHGLQLGTGGELRLLHGALADLPLREEAQAVRDTAHENALELKRPVACPDDELGGAAADVHDQPLLLGSGQLVGHPEIDEARFLAPGHDLDGELERGLRPAEERGCVLGDPQRVGAHGAHRAAVEIAQPLAKPLQARERPLL
jgi:hypothetical protein